MPSKHAMWQTYRMAKGFILGIGRVYGGDTTTTAEAIFGTRSVEVSFPQLWNHALTTKQVKDRVAARIAELPDDPVAIEMWLHLNNWKL